MTLIYQSIPKGFVHQTSERSYYQSLKVPPVPYNVPT